ncbi:MAG: zinc-dependent metalloprotease [Flavobacteriales bacterium]
MKNLLFLVPFLISLCSVAQQNTCGFDSYRNHHLENLEYEQEDNRINQLLYEQALNPNTVSRGGVRTIPLVVHVVHNNGAENISDTQIMDGIEQLNLRFQNASPYSDVSGTDVQIQFCLASINPEGDATNGITRTASNHTDINWNNGAPNDTELKNIDRWEPQLYLNVWVIRDIASLTGIIGYSSFPSSLTAYPSFDGIVIQHDYFNTSALTHEVGHYLGLYHTFEGGCLNDNCMLDGDQICDTPPDATNDFECQGNSCTTELNDTSGFSPFLIDSDDLPNYMDYTTCSLSFSQGQSSRMNAVLTDVRYELLQSNGCGQNPGGALPTASFSVSQNCDGTQLTSTGTNTIGAQWDLNNDGVIDQVGNQFIYNPPTTGNYTVTLFATGYGGTDTISQTILARHYPYQNYPMVNGYSGVTLSESGIFVACEGATITIQGAPGMAEYNWSNGDNTQNTTFVQGESDFSITLSTVDFDGNTWEACQALDVAARPATIPPTVAVHPDENQLCTGNTIDLVFTYSPAWNSGTFLGMQGFHDNTYSTTLDIVNNYVVNQTDTNGCMSASEILTIIPQSGTVPAPINNFGNNYVDAPSGVNTQWYLDGVPVPNSNVPLFQMTQTGCYRVFYWWANGYECGSFSTDSICVTITDVSTQQAENKVSIYPNPTERSIEISGIKQFPCTAVIEDATGSVLIRRPLTDKGKLAAHQINLDKLAAGIYFLRIQNVGKEEVYKVVKR